MKTGIFGGTFNPIHNGHLYIADVFRKKMHLDRVIFIPNKLSPFKVSDSDILRASHRLNMLRLAVEDIQEFEIDDVELKREGVSYSIDTINYLEKKYPEDEFFLLIGSDQALSFNKWKDYSEILRKTKVVVANRKVSKQLSDNYSSEMLLLDNDLMDISAKEIRDNIREGKAFFEFLPSNVAEYIVNNLLYL